MNTALTIEILTVLFSLGFLVLLIRENKWCWLLGIISSILSIYLFYISKLYAESVLYIFYVGMGFYGWYVWDHRQRNEDFKIVKWDLQKHLPYLGAGVLLTGIIYYIFKTYTDAARSLADSFSTSFSLVATYLEAHKIFRMWIYWIILNGFTVWLYFDRGLNIYAALMVIYFGFSIYGYFDWKKKLLNEKLN